MGRFQPLPRLPIFFNASLLTILFKNIYNHHLFALLFCWLYCQYPMPLLILHFLMVQGYLLFYCMYLSFLPGENIFQHKPSVSKQDVRRVNAVWRLLYHNTSSTFGIYTLTGSNVFARIHAYSMLRGNWCIFHFM